MTIRYGSVCSGIESASVSWHCLGWQPAWFAEIEAFPSAVLAHHWPEVTNLGDMTKIAARILAGELEAPDVLIGGTPCQAFSVAGARKGLADDRGQLTISFGELADAIDTRRAEQGKPPCVVVWENVPGVLSDKTNAFGAFLGLLAGEDCELQPPGKKWETAGCVLRGQRAIAWRVLDAQYFGVAQRRRRVFVVASAREGFDPAAVLFERDGLRRDTAPSRETGKAVAALTANGVGTCGADDNQGQAGHLIPTSEYDDNGLQRVVGTLCADTHPGAYSGQDAYTGRLVPTVSVVHGTQDPCVDNNLAFALGRNNGGENALCYQAQCVTGDITHTLKAEGFDGSEDGTGRGQPIVTAFSAKDYGADATEDLSPTLRAGNSNQGNQNSGAWMAVAFAENSRAEVRLEGVDGQVTGGCGVPTTHYGMQVRRLTPTECERLQGFPDGHTLIPESKRKKLEDDMKAYLKHHLPELDDEQLHKMVVDGPRYKALGNSKAVPVVRWLGERINAELENAIGWRLLEALKQNLITRKIME